jgi:hypothetical protein
VHEREDSPFERESEEERRLVLALIAQATGPAVAAGAASVTSDLSTALMAPFCWVRPIHPGACAFDVSARADGINVLLGPDAALVSLDDADRDARRAEARRVVTAILDGRCEERAVAEGDRSDQGHAWVQEHLIIHIEADPHHKGRRYAAYL